MPTIKVGVEFKTKATKNLYHKGKVVKFTGDKGSFQVTADKWDAILYEFRGQPGTTAKITLTPASGTLVIDGHPIDDSIALDKGMRSSTRFFKVKS